MRWFAVLGASLALSGCGAQDFFFNKDISLLPGHGQMSDIKQRGVFVQSRPDIDGVSSPVVCAEPSPDAMTAVAASLAARTDLSDTGSAALAASANESVASVGLRTQTIQLLRDGFYRMCEGYMSGALTGEDYSIMQRRYQANMLALLAIEQLTGSVRAPTVALDTSASAIVADLRIQLREVEERLRLHQQQLDAAKKKDPKPAEEITSLEKQVESDTKERDVLLKSISAAGSSIAEVELVTRQNAQVSKDVSDAVVKIAESVIQKDYAGQMCFEYFRRREAGHALSTPAGAANGGGDLRNYCSGVFRQNLDAMRTSLEFTNSCLRLADALREKGKLPEAREQFKLCSADQIALAPPASASSSPPVR